MTSPKRRPRRSPRCRFIALSDPLTRAGASYGGAQSVNFPSDSFGSAFALRRSVVPTPSETVTAALVTEGGRHGSVEPLAA